MNYTEAITIKTSNALQNDIVLKSKTEMLHTIITDSYTDYSYECKKDSSELGLNSELLLH